MSLKMFVLELSVIALARDESVSRDALDALAAMGETGQLETSDDMYYAADRAMLRQIVRRRHYLRRLDFHIGAERRSRQLITLHGRSRKRAGRNQETQ